MKCYIKAIASYLPEQILTNEELVTDFPEWSVESIAEKIGVVKRHIAAPNETASDMAIKAAEKLFDNFSDIPRASIDFVLYCTQSPDYILPTSACIIQEKLKLNTNIGAIDFNLGCSGYVYGLALAKGLIAGNIAKNVLLLTGETYSKHIHFKDKSNRTIFGDGATATVVSTNGFAEIGEFSLGTDGKGAENLIVKSGGARHSEKLNDLSFDEKGNPHSSDFLFMNGGEIFSFTQKNVPKVVKNCLEKNSLTIEAISAFVFHQANSYMLEFLRKKIKIDSQKFVIDMSETGNTVSNSIPLLLEKMMNNCFTGEVLICGFGVGYSWGATILSFIRQIN